VSATKLKDEACVAVVKLDEARLLMNRLLGPQGPLNQAERHKYLPGRDDADYQIGPDDSRPVGQAKGITDQMQQSNS